ncbi:cytochrome P450 [Athelia psychrophila]|uniref:Cytochrome P450 n=1 Tax=Athelia psychrophila TaxID=1759441 RepID=A0A166K9Z1_9AGAM|nr:cytochrome P450 [Fibularhizoctonia sp. CBS 109695]
MFSYNVLDGSSNSLLKCATALALTVVAFALRFQRKRTNIAFVPIPDGSSWIWGHEKTIFDKSTGTAYTEWFSTLNAYVIRVKGALFKPDILIVADPAAISHIMRKQIYQYEHNGIVRPRIARLLGKSLGWVEGESEHKRMRQLVASSLSQEAVKKGYQDLLDAAENSRAAIEEHLHKSGSYTDFKTIDITKWTLQATLDAIGRFGFGHDFDSGRSEEATNILKVWRDMAKVVMSPHGFLPVMLMRRFGFINNLPLKALQAQANVRLMIHEGVAREMVARNTKLTSGAASGNDLLSRLMVAQRDGAISQDELMDHISMFIMTGSETTGQALGAAIWELGRNLEAQKRLREEVQSYSNEPTFDEMMTKMTYIDAVCRETLRMHPPAPYMERDTTKDDVLPLRYPIMDKDGKVHTHIFIKAGQTVIIPIHSVQRMDPVWGDGAAFRPERWLTAGGPAPVEQLTGGWSNMLAFSDGPRSCVGVRLALVEFKVILAMLVRNFQFGSTGDKMSNKFASSMQAVVVGREIEGPQLPVTIAPL